MHLQILASMDDLPRCHKHHFAAFIRNPAKLVVWDDHPETVLLRAETLEQMIVKHIWQLVNQDDDEDGDKKVGKLPKVSEELSLSDLEAGNGQEVRKTKLTSCLVVSCALAIELVCLGLGWRMLSLQVAVDRNYYRLLIALVSPFTMFLSLVRNSRRPLLILPADMENSSTSSSSS